MNNKIILIFTLMCAISSTVSLQAMPPKPLLSSKRQMPHPVTLAVLFGATAHSFMRKFTQNTLDKPGIKQPVVRIKGK